MDEFFSKIESITHQEIPGLVSSKDYKSLMKIAEHYGCSELQLLQNKNIGIQFTTKWSTKLLYTMNDREGRRLAQPLCERIQQRVNRYIKRELKLFLNTVQV